MRARWPLAATTLAACWSAPPGPPPPAPPRATIAQRSHAMTGPEQQGAACPAIEPDDDLHVVVDHQEVGIAPATCAAATGHYHAFVKRADGWYRSRPLFAFAVDGRHCNLDVRASLEDARPSRVVLRVRSALGCVACDNQGESSSGLEFLVVIDTSDATPRIYEPIEIGQHYRQTLGDDGDPATDCPTIERHVVLEPTWSRAGELTLRGPSTWQAVARDARAFQLHGLGEAAAPAPTPVGTHRFTRQ